MKTSDGGFNDRPLWMMMGLVSSIAVFYKNGVLGNTSGVGTSGDVFSRSRSQGWTSAVSCTILHGIWSVRVDSY